MKKFILILIGISIVLGGIIYFLYQNGKEANEEVVDIFKEDKKEEEIINIEKNEISKVIVDIKGMVSSPGVYEVESGKRVNDVINMAGGLLEEADTSNINLAKIVTDEMAIIIYSKEEVLEKYKNEVCVCDCPDIINDACITEEKNDNNLININTSDAKELTSLDGLGEAKAKAIIEYRNKNGMFKKIEEVKNVPGIGEAIFEKIKNSITI